MTRRSRPRTIGPLEQTLLVELARCDEELRIWTKRRGEVAARIMRERVAPENEVRVITMGRAFAKRVGAVVVGLLLGSGVAWAQNSWPAGTPLVFAWDARPAAEEIIRYETKIDAGAYVTVGLATSWNIPAAGLTRGQHTAYARACNQTGCGVEGSVAYTMTLPLPGALQPRINPIPAGVALNRRQGEVYSDAFCQWAVDRSCTRTEYGIIEARHRELFATAAATKWTLLVVLNALEAERPQ